MNFLKKIVFSVYMGLISYFLMNPIFSQRGIINHIKMDNKIQVVSENIKNLEKIQEDLKTKYIKLQVSNSQILKQASLQDYFEKNSKVIKIKNKNSLLSAGKMIKIDLEEKRTSKYYVFAILSSLFTYLLLSHIYLIKKNKNRE